MNQEEKEEPHCELENDFLNDDLSLIIECNTFDPAYTKICRDEP